MPKNGEKWNLLSSIKGGHKFFTDVDDPDRVAISDDSHYWPDDSLTGVEIIDKSEPVRYVGGFFSFTVANPKRSRLTSTVCSDREAAFLIEKFGMKLQLDGQVKPLLLRPVSDPAVWPEPLGETPIPGPIPEYHRNNFEVLIAAASQDRLAAVSAVRRKNRAQVTLICAMSSNDDETISPMPIGQMLEVDPFEEFEDPTVITKETPCPGL